MPSRKATSGLLLLMLLGIFATLLAPPRAGAQGVPFIRGDTDHNGSHEITDAIFILEFLFLGGPEPACRPIANANADAAIDITDAVFLLGFLFLGTEGPGPLAREDLIDCLNLDPAAVERGMRVYEMPAADDPSDPADNPNSFACGTCHLMIPDSQSEVLLPGHSLHDALRRPNFKDGQRANFLGGANVCRKDWMIASLWTEDDREFQDLVAFMESMSPQASAPALEYEIVPPAASGPPAGCDGIAGCRLFNRSCAVCHGKGAVGRTAPEFFAPSLRDLPFELLRGAGIDPHDYIRRRIRLSGPLDSVYPGLAGNGIPADPQSTVMPFWSKDKLSDAQVEDLAAFIDLAHQAFLADPNAVIDCDDPPDDGGRVLRRGALVDRGTTYGPIAGTVEELESGKIRITGFNYGGRGFNVKVWLFKAGSPREGCPTGPQLVGLSFRDETFVVDIAAECAQMGFDSVSIWCVSARVDFASAALAPVAAP